MSQNSPNPEGGDAKIDFSVLGNGLDFIATALAHLRGEPSPRDLKYAVLHLSAGIELVMKDRLRREHWSLVFADINKADATAYLSGDFYSVDLKDCIKRLLSICNVSLSEGDKSGLLNLRSKRNRWEHFASVDSTEAIKASTATVVNFAIDFIAREFQLSSNEQPEIELLDTIRSILPEFKQFVEERLRLITPELEALDTPIVECPRCVQETMHFDDGAQCSFCGYSADGEKAASDYAFSLFGMDWKYVADGGFVPVYRCPECWAESFVDVGKLKQVFDGDRLICFSCSTTLSWDEAEICPRCGNPFSRREDGVIVCSDCFP